MPAHGLKAVGPCTAGRGAEPAVGGVVVDAPPLPPFAFACGGSCCCGAPVARWCRSAAGAALAASSCGDEDGRAAGRETLALIDLGE